MFFRSFRSNGTQGMYRSSSTFVLLYLLHSAGALAQISLNLGAEVSVDPPDLNIRIMTANQGRETAHGVQATLRHGSEVITLPVRNQLAPGTAHEVEANLSIAEASPGRHPFYVQVGYADANGYQFSAVLCATFWIEEDTSSEIFGVLRTEPLDDTGQLQVDLKNLSEEDISFDLVIFMPREFSTDEYDREILLEANQEKSVLITLRNFAAIPESSYPVYAIVQYLREGLQYTNVLGGQVEVRASEQQLVTRYRLWIFGAAVLLILLGVGVPIVRSIRS